MMQNTLGKIGGKQVIISTAALEEVIKIRKRTWRERLFTIPFRPFKKLITYLISRPCMYFVGEVLLVHPSLKTLLSESI